MSTLDKTIAKIHANFGHDFTRDIPEILRTQKSADGTVKFLFGLRDQNRVESVNPIRECIRFVDYTKYFIPGVRFNGYMGRIKKNHESDRMMSRFLFLDMIAVML